MASASLAFAQAGNVQNDTQTPNTQNDTQATGPRHRGHYGDHSGRHLDMLSQKLNLTDQQKSQLQSLFQNQRSQIDAIRQDSSLTPEQKRERIHQLHQSSHTQFLAALTPEQKQQLEQMRAQRGERGLEMLSQRLNLTPDQQSKLKPILEAQHKQMEALRDDNSLTPEQRMARAREIHQSSKSQLSSILTPEQLQRLQQMHDRRGGRHHGKGKGFGHGPGFGRGEGPGTSENTAPAENPKRPQF
jgi:Spy/CpxP family protein refolding chaperone